MHTHDLHIHNTQCTYWTPLDKASCGQPFYHLSVVHKWMQKHDKRWLVMWDKQSRNAVSRCLRTNSGSGWNALITRITPQMGNKPPSLGTNWPMAMLMRKHYQISKYDTWPGWAQKVFTAECVCIWNAWMTPCMLHTTYTDMLSALTHLYTLTYTDTDSAHTHNPRTTATVADSTAVHWSLSMLSSYSTN